MSYSVRCPVCGHHKARVHANRYVKKDGAIIRGRRCDCCGYEYKTAETIIEESPHNSFLYIGNLYATDRNRVRQMAILLEPEREKLPNHKWRV